MKPRRNPSSFLRRFWNDQRGISSIIVTILAVVFVELMGLVVDFGHVFWVQRALQAQTDAAALAGAYQIPNSTAIATATSFSGTGSNQNAIATVPATFAPGYPLLKCLTSTNVTCSGTELPGTGANAIQVQEQSTVSTFFTRIAGISSLTVKATSTAGSKGGTGKSVNVIILLDTTGSMGTTDTNGCGISGATREQCALAGVQALLQGLNPQLDHVGLMTFPGLQDPAQTSTLTACNQSLPSSDIQDYNNSPTYTITRLSSGNDFKSSPTATTLNTGSNIVLATGGAGCTSGISNHPSSGSVSTYYAAAIKQAQAQLVGASASNVQNAIVILSDGGANSPANETDVTASIAGTTMTVTACPKGCAVSNNSLSEAPLNIGETITGTGVTSGTTITAQTAGVTGGVGVYTVSKSQTVSSRTLTAAASIIYNGQTFQQNTEQCQQGIAAAQAAAAAKTWIFSVAYGASTATGNASTCTTDRTAGSLAGLSSCTTMQDMASDSSKFYSDGSNGTDCPGANTIENLVTLFKNISTTLTQPRLLPDNTT
jgi:Flp pilus assembly protein TadG